MYHRSGVVGLFLEGAYADGGGGENAELRSYVMARQLWDPATDINQAVDEFLEGYSGKAARHMREYFDLLHAQVRISPAGRGAHLWIFVNPGAPYLDGEFLSRAAAVFRRALDAAESETVRQRVRKASLSVDYALMSRAMEFTVQGERYAPDRLEDLIGRFRSFMSELKTFGILSLHEGRLLKDDDLVYRTLARTGRTAEARCRLFNRREIRFFPEG